MSEDIKVGDLVHYKGGRDLYLVLGKSSPHYVSVRKYVPGTVFTEIIKITRLLGDYCTKDVFQTALMNAQLHEWFKDKPKGESQDA